MVAFNLPCIVELSFIAVACQGRSMHWRLDGSQTPFARGDHCVGGWVTVISVLKGSNSACCFGVRLYVWLVTCSSLCQTLDLLGAAVNLYVCVLYHHWQRPLSTNCTCCPCLLLYSIHTYNKRQTLVFIFKIKYKLKGIHLFQENVSNRVRLEVKALTSECYSRHQRTTAYLLVSK